MDLTRRWTATAVAFVAVAGLGGLSGSPAGASPRAERPEEVEAKANHHSHDVCEEKKDGFASCLAKVIDRGASSPSPLVYSAPYGVAPAALKAAYGFPTDANAGAGTTIGIIAAYDNPTIQSELDVFSSTYGLPCNGCLTKVNQSGGTSYPATNSSWALETSLDVQWAHAIAPGAKILLVEATTNSWSNLMAAVDYAKVRAQYVSMSWGGPEFSSQVNYDSRFVAPGVSFFASSGDSGLPAQYPSASPNLVSVGGTTLSGLGTSTITETAWSSGGGGCSLYANANPAQKAFSQYAQAGCKAGKRATPDVSLDADPASGVSVYNATPPNAPGWYKVGGTSASSPMWAARSAVAGGVVNSAKIYGTTAPPLRDVTSGNNGAPALAGYDMASGRGSWFDGTLPPAAPPPPPPTGSGLSNGGFETGSLASWTPGGAASSIVSGSALSGTYAAQAGSTAPTSGDSNLVQNFTAPAGSSQLTFSYKQTCPDNVAFDWATATLQDLTTGASTTILPRTCTTGPWAQVSAPITAGHGYSLTLTDHDDNAAGDATSTLFDAVTTA